MDKKETMINVSNLFQTMSESEKNFLLGYMLATAQIRENATAQAHA